jgi:hypothetical protein
MIPSKLPNLQNNPLVLTLPRADPAAAFQRQLEDCTLPIAIRRAGRPRIKKALDQVLFSNHFQKRHLKNKALVSSMEGSRKVKKLYWNVFSVVIITWVAGGRIAKSIILSKNKKVTWKMNGSTEEGELIREHLAEAQISTHNLFAQVSSWREILNILDWKYASYCKDSSIAYKLLCCILHNSTKFKGVSNIYSCQLFF